MILWAFVNFAVYVTSWFVAKNIDIEHNCTYSEEYEQLSHQISEEFGSCISNMDIENEAKLCDCYMCDNRNEHCKNIDIIMNK